MSGTMASTSGGRGRQMVNKILKNKDSEAKNPAEEKKDSKQPPCKKPQILIDVSDPGKIWSYEFDYNDFSYILKPSVEYSSSQNFPRSDLDNQIEMLKFFYSVTENTNLMCNESFPDSLLSPMIDINDLMDTSAVDNNNFEELGSLSMEACNDNNLVCKELGSNRMSTEVYNKKVIELESDSIMKNSDIALNIDKNISENTLNDCNNMFEMHDKNTRALTERQNEMQNVQNNAETSMSEGDLERIGGCISESNREEVERIENIEEIELLHASKGRTKTGKPRVRRHIEEPVHVRKQEHKRLKLEKFSIKPGCDLKCKKKCNLSFSETERLRINKNYWELSYESQGVYIKSTVLKQDVKRRLVHSKMMRNNTYKYFFEKENGHKTEVCKIFYLTTLGFKKGNDTRILQALLKPLNCQSDKRGKREHTEKIDRNKLRQHIESFKPAVAHYRRSHAPNRWYLPSDLNVKFMFNDFKQKNPDLQLSYELYRNYIKQDMNISFTQLGNEECEICESHKIHKPNCKDLEDCNVCASFNVHRTKYQKAWTFYQKDVELATESANSEKAFFSADLQKVVMLPRIDMFKAVLFCPRIIAFNESFVPLGPSSASSQPFAVLWHEATAGRKQEDIISAYRVFFISKRDCSEITVWADNCSGQNKNWAFFTFLVQFINGSEVSANKIIIKYLEIGHTFMSADHFHHQVENQLKRAGKVYDFADFVDCVQLANSNKVCVKAMDVNDFYKFIDQSSQHKLKKNKDRIYLKDIVSVEVHRQNFNLLIKTEYDGNSTEIDFLKLKIMKQRSFPDPIQSTKPRGIASERKEAILNRLSSLMPENRLVFWKNLPTNEDSANLVECIDVEEFDN